MLRYSLPAVASVLLLVSFAGPVESQVQSGDSRAFAIGNGLLTCRVLITHGHLALDRVALRSGSGKVREGAIGAVETDAGFALELMWSDWRAPGKANNADNPVVLTKNDFTFCGGDSTSGSGGEKKLCLRFAGPERGFALRITYTLGREDFYVRRSLEVCDSTNRGHLLRELRARDGVLFGNPEVVKEGGFGQPVALRIKRCGAFFGSEYPASRNSLQSERGALHLRCAEEVGELITERWLGGAPVVEAVTPATLLKNWFWKYVDDIRIAPARPYTLYNSWYDLRSPEYPKIPPANVMNEENILRIIGLIDKNMISRHRIHLDAFVLDDGWDVYESDWLLRRAQFPHGLRPIADTLAKTHTDLGLWIGPSGGYSFRDRRISWMREHGYEIVDDQLCLAGKNYSALFRKRVEDFVRGDGVAYFKWDGIQFACNQADHGHPTDVYSRRAVLQSLIDKCTAVRSITERTYLNITSGTWLSPWWLKHANQIWMDFDDYGYAELPSLSPRDAAMTYRDAGLYADFAKKDLWFPIANLMTHGIIKGTLEQLGGTEEPLDRFTNETLLYVARGVSMWELYISPDILTEAEWDAIAQSIEWARDRFPVLSTTTLIGGNPTAGQTYAYLHFQGKRGVIAARNPVVEPKTLQVSLSAKDGLDPQARSLVLERVYPTRHIFPALYRAGSKITLRLGAYETAVFEIYPLSSARLPLLSGVDFEAAPIHDGLYTLKCYGVTTPPVLLNPASTSGITSDGESLESRHLALGRPPLQPPVDAISTARHARHDTCTVLFRINQSARNASLAVLLESSPGEGPEAMPQIGAIVDKFAVPAKIQTQKGLWGWYSFPLQAGEHSASFYLLPSAPIRSWRGKARAYLVCDQMREPVVVTFHVRDAPPERPMPPCPRQPGAVHRLVQLGQWQFDFSRGK